MSRPDFFASIRGQFDDREAMKVAESPVLKSDQEVAAMFEALGNPDSTESILSQLLKIASYQSFQIGHQNIGQLIPILDPRSACTEYSKELALKLVLDMVSFNDQTIIKIFGSPHFIELFQHYIPNPTVFSIFAQLIKSNASVQGDVFADDFPQKIVQCLRERSSDTSAILFFLSSLPSLSFLGSSHLVLSELLIGYLDKCGDDELESEVIHTLIKLIEQFPSVGQVILQRQSFFAAFSVKSADDLSLLDLLSLLEAVISSIHSISPLFQPQLSCFLKESLSSDPTVCQAAVDLLGKALTSTTDFSLLCSQTDLVDLLISALGTSLKFAQTEEVLDILCALVSVTEPSAFTPLTNDLVASIIPPLICSLNPGIAERILDLYLGLIEHYLSQPENPVLISIADSYSFHEALDGFEDHPKLAQIASRIEALISQMKK